jgi:hypothetical protein
MLGKKKYIKEQSLATMRYRLYRGKKRKKINI